MVSRRKLPSSNFRQLWFGGGRAGDVQSYRPETKAARRWVPRRQRQWVPRWWRRPGGGARGGRGAGVEVGTVEAGAVEKPGRLFLYLDFYMCHEHIVLPFFC
jgi:hypothetical protein